MLGMTTVGLAGSLLACPTGTPSYDRSTGATSGRRRFDGKVVIITGATSGIGRTAALQFAAESGNVSFCGLRENLGRTVENGIKTQAGEAIYIRADVRNESDVKAFVDQTVQKYGRLDVAFNNPGIMLERPLHQYSSPSATMCSIPTCGEYSWP